MAKVNRRRFLAGAAAASVTLAAGRPARAAAANDTVVLALMGANSRGSQLARGLARQPGAEIAYICDCDERAIGKGIEAATSEGGRTPQGIKDFRRALDDPAVDGLICAAPNHWHAAATVLACAAGKHVYVEKPCSHTADEGERMIAAARDSGRVVQVGMQRRSGPLYQQVVERIGEGVIGRVLYGRSWYNRRRPSIGRGRQVPPPAWLDYDLWQGPVTEMPFQDNLVHYNWHFFWHWGDAELGNNGIHTIDICRWALGVDYPSRVTASGARLRYEDDQLTPDTCLATFECDGRVITWEGISWSQPYRAHGQIGIELRGEDGTLTVNDQGYTVYDPQRKVVEEGQGSRGDDEHLANFLDAIRDDVPLHATIEEGHKSAMFCHLGNMAYRTGLPIEVDSTNGHLKNSPQAEQYWKRAYRPGWFPAV